MLFHTWWQINFTTPELFQRTSQAGGHNAKALPYPNYAFYISVGTHVSLLSANLLMLVLSLMPHTCKKKKIFFMNSAFILLLLVVLFTAVGLNWFTNDKCWCESFKFSMLQWNKQTNKHFGHKILFITSVFTNISYTHNITSFRISLFQIIHFQYLCKK